MQTLRGSAYVGGARRAIAPCQQYVGTTMLQLGSNGEAGEVRVHTCCVSGSPAHAAQAHLVETAGSPPTAPVAPHRNRSVRLHSPSTVSINMQASCGPSTVILCNSVIALCDHRALREEGVHKNMPLTQMSIACGS